MLGQAQCGVASKLPLQKLDYDVATPFALHFAGFNIQPGEMHRTVRQHY